MIAGPGRAAVGNIGRLKRGAFTFRALRPRPAQVPPPLHAGLEIASRPGVPEAKAWDPPGMAVNHGLENCFNTRDAL